MKKTTAESRPFPELGKVFKLTLDGDAPENQPLAMVEAAGYGSPGDWGHDGRRVEGGQTRRFRLIQKGGTWDEIGCIIGDEVEGQWILVFMAAFSGSDGKGHIGVHDSSWVRPFRNSPAFPYVHKDGRLAFNWIDRGFTNNWRWLVPA